jgi:Fe-S cluster biogenesis protein NfuA
MRNDTLFAGVDDAVEEVARILRADGADLRVLTADARTARLHLALVLDSVSCDECVLGPETLFETIEQALHRRVRGEFELVLDDPRRAPSS